MPEYRSRISGWKCHNFTGAVLTELVIQTRFGAISRQQERPAWRDSSGCALAAVIIYGSGTHESIP